MKRRSVFDYLLA